MIDAKKLIEAEEQAVERMINFAKSDRNELNEEDISAVEKCMVEAECYEPLDSEARLVRKRIEANTILRECIMPTNRKQLRKIEAAIMEIVPLYCESCKTS